MECILTYRGLFKNMEYFSGILPSDLLACVKSDTELPVNFLSYEGKKKFSYLVEKGFNKIGPVIAIYGGSSWTPFDRNYNVGTLYLTKHTDLYGLLYYTDLELMIRENNIQIPVNFIDLQALENIQIDI